jgi:hypothetical protein
MLRDKKRKEGEQEHSHWQQHARKVEEVEEDDNDFCYSIGDLVSINDGWNSTAAEWPQVIQGIVVARKLAGQTVSGKPMDHEMYMVCLTTDGIMRAPDWYSSLDLDLLSSAKESE